MIVSYTVSCSPGAISISGAIPPILLTSLTNGTTYSCSVTATNATGTSVPTAPVIFTPQPALALVGIFSRKIHGSAGIRDLPINGYAPIAGNVTVEPRVLGGGHNIVFRINQPVTAPGTTSVLDASSAGVPHTAAYAGDEVVVTIPALANGKRLTISISGINGSLGGTVSIGFLIGDVNSSRVVDITDVRAVKARAGWLVDSTNFHSDINLSGRITSADVLGTKARQGAALP